MSQTSYSLTQAIGREGQLADAGDNDVYSFVNPAVALPFGKLAVANGTDGQVKLPTAADDITTAKLIAGVVLASQNMESDGSALADYPVGSVVPCLRKGRVIVQVEEAVTNGSDVFVRYAAGGNGLGSFGDTAGTSERAQLAGARYLTSAAANGLAVLEINVMS